MWSSTSGWWRLWLLHVACNCPSRSQDSVLGMLCVVLTALVTLLLCGAMARVIALMAATNLHPVVGGPEEAAVPLQNAILILFLFTLLLFFFFYLMVHISLSSGKTCSISNGSCSHLCTDEARGARCACPVGYELSSNGTDCSGLFFF